MKKKLFQVKKFYDEKVWSNGVGFFCTKDKSKQEGKTTSLPNVFFATCNFCDTARYLILLMQHVTLLDISRHAGQKFFFKIMEKLADAEQ